METLFSFGNSKLPVTTAIFNLAPAKECPSEKLGLCALCNVCYAKKAERLYPSCLPYRMRQMNFWLNATAEEFIIAFDHAKKSKTNAVRFNESGDFHSQNCVDKMEAIAKLMKDRGITAYVYTARRDLDYSKCKYLQVVASGFDKAGINCQFIGVKDAKLTAQTMRAADKTRKYAVCCGDCKKCSLCQTAKNTVIYCELH